jgi:hypothetical protein
MFLRKIRESHWAKVVSLLLALELITDYFIPNQAKALTTGPSQPEVQNFQPVGTSDMVNVFTGDFSYNIPLLDVDGYPINISYASGVTTDQEASWVGLGWNINPGTVNRSMRGLPDDFDGEKITKTFNMKPNRTFGVSFGAGGEAFGSQVIGLSYGITANFNNYQGVGLEQSLNLQFNSGNKAKGPLTGDLGITSGADGVNLSPCLSFSKAVKRTHDYDVKGTGSIGLSYNSRHGLKKLSLNASLAERAYASKDDPKHIKQTYSANGSASIDFSTQTYSPQVNMSMINTSFGLSFKTGATAFGVDGTWNLSGYYSEQDLLSTTVQSPAYGYLNTQHGVNDSRSLNDINREKEIAFTDRTPDLPMTNYSYDVFSVNGQGIGGNYRAFRSDLGTVSDPEASTLSSSGNEGLEFGIGNLAHDGVDISITDVNTTSGKWSGDDNASSILKFRNGSTSDPLFEPAYFKQAGEKAVDSDPALYNAIGKSDPVRVSLQAAGNPSMTVTATSNFDRQYTDGHISNIAIPSSVRTSRQRRNQPISFLNFRDSAYALQSSILDHTNATMPAYSGARGNHIGEVTTLRSDGARYVYGLPAYNISQKEVTFAVQYRTHDCGTGIVTYDSTGSADNSISNKLGIDHYYSATETPAYAHSYLLTAIISPDYVDYDNVEGPSKGDLGSYTKFNYTKANSDFKWRTPVGAASANFNEGMKSESSDDKGSYVYGEKEIWYVSSIETKNYIAVFHLSDREDGLGVTGENGKVGGTALKKLDRIDLYTKPDYDRNGVNATPIKSVHFEYNYSLCPGTPNRNPTTNGHSESGKLTLKKIYFTYQKSYKAKLSNYQFNYADNDQNGTAEANFRYNLKGYDRWGDYKRNPASSSCGIYDSLTTAEFPYTDQDSTLANKYSSAWALTSIKLPSGATIKVKYESDDYAYVQDRKAMQMFKIIDVKIASSGPSFPDTLATPYDTTLMNTNYSTDQYYLFFRLQRPILSTGVSTVQAADTILKKYLGDSLKNIYFRFFSDITNRGDHEYVSGYFDVDDYGVAASVNNTYRFGWVRVKKVPIGDREGSDACNPICVANWQYGRLNLPRKVWDQPDPQEGTVDQVIEELATLPFTTATNLLHTFKSPNKVIRDKGYGLRAVMNKSWIRMNNPYGKKFGGGSRVKSVTISDNWKAMVNDGSTPNDATYGQTYSYTTTDPSTGQLISSGVASYEPSIGGDENPFRRPVYFSEKHRLAPDDESYMEEPFGEMFFPAPGVGYSRVKVQNLQFADVGRHATGYTVQEFYTAKDFPTITRRTEIQTIHKRTNPILSLLRITMKDYVTASQGYVIELNDMHGKPKSQLVYAEGQSAPISEVHYFYKVNSSNGRQLDNEVYTINKDGSVGKNSSGLDYDFVNDMREENTKMVSGGVQTNVATFLAAIFPGVVPTIYPTWSSEDTRFRSSVITKVINRYGILERTEAHDAGSTVTTENLAWDAVTGELLVTKTKNDFDDPVYNLTYPAHWTYDQMGPAYQNLMTSFQHVTISGGSATIASAEDYFVPGDEVGVTKNSDNTHYKYWVCSISGSTVNLMDKNGAAAAVSGTHAFTMLITRSGRRNQQALAVGGVTLLTNPLVDTTGDGIYDAIQYNKVINAKSQEYADHWMMMGGHITPNYTTCDCGTTELAGAVSLFLGKMAEDGKLLTDSTLLYNSGTSTAYHDYGSALNAFLPSGQNMSWFPHANGQLLTALIAHGPDSSGCTVTMLLPAPYTWDQVTALADIEPVSDPGDCSGGVSHTFKMKATLANGAEVYITGTTPCWEIGNSCDPSYGESSQCGKMAGDAVNPYYEDILGVWRPLRSSLYLADRKQTTTSNNVDARKDGYFITHDHTTGSTIDFQPFWIPNAGNDWLKDSTYWTWSSEVTKYTPFSNEVENRDALSRYSAAVYGYNNTLPIAVASNARYQEIAYDGFEDYSYVDSTDCRYQHFNYYDNRSKRSTAEAHTGLYSMKIAAHDSIASVRSLTSFAALPSTGGCPYKLSNFDLTGVFSPITYNGAKKYVLNYWVKEDTLTAPVFSYPDGKVIVKFLNGSGTPTFPAMTLVQKSSIIEGWQQYQYTFTIPAGQTGAISVVLKNSGSHSVYFDDIRLHPFDANMKTYVYHPLNLRFIDELDENNYATIYEYDEDGTLTRVKKETINGIMTIKESRNNSSH